MRILSFRQSVYLAGKCIFISARVVETIENSENKVSIMACFMNSSFNPIGKFDSIQQIESEFTLWKY